MTIDVEKITDYLLLEVGFSGLPKLLFEAHAFKLVENL